MFLQAQRYKGHTPEYSSLSNVCFGESLCECCNIIRQSDYVTIWPTTFAYPARSFEGSAKSRHHSRRLLESLWSCNVWVWFFRQSTAGMPADTGWAPCIILSCHLLADRHRLLQETIVFVYCCYCYCYCRDVSSKNTGRGCSKTGCWGQYLGLGGKK